MACVEGPGPSIFPSLELEIVVTLKEILTWSKSPLGKQRSVDCKTRKTSSHGEEEISSRQRVSNWQRQLAKLQVSVLASEAC